MYSSNLHVYLFIYTGCSWWFYNRGSFLPSIPFYPPGYYLFLTGLFFPFCLFMFPLSTLFSQSVCKNTHVFIIKKKVLLHFRMVTSFPESLAFAHYQTSLNQFFFLGILLSGYDSHHSTESSLTSNLILLNTMSIFVALILPDLCAVS